MNIFEYNSIQELIEQYISDNKALGIKVTYQGLSESMRIQKSYLSKVMKKDAYLSKDQLFLLSKTMKLSSEERDYLFLLADRDKVAITELQNELSKKIKELQNKNTKSENYLKKETIKLNKEELNKYYLTPENQLIHLALGIIKFQNKPELLIDVFNVSTKQFKASISLLKELKLIEVKNDKIKILKSNLHLSKDSIYFQGWLNQLKLKSIEHLKKVDSENKYNFTVTYSCSKNDQEKIRLEFMKYLKKVESIVKKSEAKSLYQMNFDLFKWT